MATKTVSLPKGAQYHCDYCRKDISHTIRIKCAHQQCPDFDLCVECFSVGVEIQKHKNDHPYYVMDQLKFPVLDKMWLASEELLLLEGIEMHGMGNWDDISDHVSTKSSDDCRDHYFSLYVESPTCPLPDLSKTFTDEEVAEAVKNSMNAEIVKPVRKTKTPGSQPMDQDLAGFMPRRGEFEVEYDNDAEYILTDMAFNDDDTPTERELKIAALHIYNQKIEKRVENRNFVVQHQLHDLKRMQHKDRRRSKETKTIYKRTRKLLQFVEIEEHEEFVKDLAAENVIRKRINDLLEYRKKGIRSMIDASNYDSLCRRRETQARKQRRESSNIYGYPERSKERGSRWLNRDKDPDAPQPVEVDISNAPGYDLLSLGERQLCESLYLYPSQYMIIKDALVKEYLKTGNLQKSTARFLVKIDVNKTSQVFDFLEQAGWINAQ
uniref:Transcriptional adapter n=1 Tax=Vannella robusta TaxID=1487602 RepID=A0A7S4MA68_9EUKA|mmetsp:Transcript_16011/g.20466  ORF Transcript_16011/g.20466 Transcript_16011/m.20466 type:complete len:437 (+) Transcript_16011:31-1341(+)